MRRTLDDQVRARAGDRCEYCHIPQRYDAIPFELEHIIAKKHKGKTVSRNLCLACFSCNRHKGANIAGLDPVTKKLTPLFDPRRQGWKRHFRWDGPLLAGKTGVGRTTIAVLAINHALRMQLRRELIEEGIFPLLRVR